MPPKAPIFTLAHLSDPHLGPLPEVGWRDLASKRVLGYANWRLGRKGSLAEASLGDLIDDIRAHEPDHIAVTGDLVNLGLPAEVDSARNWLAALGPEDDITVVPGNHDAYLPATIGHYSSAWGPYMRGDQGETGFPFVRRRGPVAVVGTSSAVATPPFMATGHFGQEQAGALAEALDVLGREGLFRVVLIHHPPAPRSAPWSRRLIGAEHFRRAIAEAGAELVLHGHNHATSIGAIAGPKVPVPVVGATSASLKAHRGRPGGTYILHHIGRENGRFVSEMTERGARLPGGPVETLAKVSLHG